MSDDSELHVVTVGWDPGLIEQLADPVEEKSRCHFSHITHPRYIAENWPHRSQQAGIYFFRDRFEEPMPAPDRELLASLERDGVPSLHNMILGDRVVSKLPYEDSLGYATFLVRRLMELWAEIKPDAIVVGFDSIHGSLALAVAKNVGIPAYALHFSVIPPRLACFCDRMSPAARVLIREWPADDLAKLATRSWQQFKSREIQARAYIAPAPLSLAGKIGAFPAKLVSTLRIGRNWRRRNALKFTESRNNYSAASALRHIYRVVRGRRAVSAVHTLSDPPSTPFVLFGLHMQPESSIDVWAPFFSNQLWVVEFLSRSMPPTHRLLVKIHKSDLASYSRTQLERLQALPGVELVAPFADTRAFLERADLLIAIQGTMGLEAALIGKPVIMLGDSPVTGFPSASAAGSLREMPSLVRRKLAEPVPSRSDILKAYETYLAPFFPASDNTWKTGRTAEEIDGYVAMFDALREHLLPQVSIQCQESAEELCS